MAAVQKPHDMENLVARIADGDKQAFGELYEQLAPRIKGYLLRLRCPEGPADELMQEVMLTIWRKAPLFNPEKAAVTTWFYTIARNRFIDRTRKQKLSAYDLLDPAFERDQPKSPAEKIEEDQKAKAVREAIKKLPEDQQEVIKMSFLEHKTHVEISERLDIPLGTVKSRMRLAFGKLKPLLENFS